MLIGPQNLEARVRAVRERIDHATARAGRNRNCVTLIAASKSQSAEKVRAAAAAGLSQFGENYVQEACEKMRALDDLALGWHFIGALQANKTRSIARHFDWVHSIDRLTIAARLAAQRSVHVPPLNVCVQVQLIAEETKAGVPPAKVHELLMRMRPLERLRVRGLMCIPPPLHDASAQRALFGRMQSLLAGLIAQGHDLDTLSMGMSDDFELAISAGATMVRVGTAIFGPRLRTAH